MEKIRKFLKNTFTVVLFLILFFIEIALALALTMGLVFGWFSILIGLFGLGMYYIFNIKLGIPLEMLYITLFGFVLLVFSKLTIKILKKYSFYKKDNILLN